MLANKLKGFARKLPLALSMVSVGLLASLAFSTVAHAVPAMPEPMPFRQADGTYVFVQARGDEFFNWRESQDGYIIQFDFDSQNWYYATSIAADGNALAGNQIVGSAQSSAADMARMFGAVTPGRITASDHNFIEIANEIAELNKQELLGYEAHEALYAHGADAQSGLSAQAFNQALEGRQNPPHIPVRWNDTVSRPHQPLLVMMIEWNNVMLNPARSMDNRGWSQNPADWSYAHLFEGNAHAFWATRTFGTHEAFAPGTDMIRSLHPGASAELVYGLYDSSGTVHGFGDLTVNNWMLEATGGRDQFIRPDGMGLDGMWGGTSSVTYFTDEVMDAIHTYGYFHADRARLLQAGVTNAWFVHIEHGVVSVRLDAGHPGYNIAASPGLAASANATFGAVAPFLDWGAIPRLGGDGPNRYDVLAQDLNLYFVYTGFEGSLGGNIALPSFWGHASVGPWRNSVSRPANPDTGCTGLEPSPVSGHPARRLASVTFAQAGGPFGNPVRATYGSHGEQSQPGVAQGLGIYIHELGHSVWGLPDKAVGGGIGAEELCVGFWCGMGRGSWGAMRYSDYNTRLGTTPAHFRSTFAYELGWLTPMALDANDNWSGYIGHWSDEYGLVEGGRTVRHWDDAIHRYPYHVPMAVKVSNTTAMYELFGLEVGDQGPGSHPQDHHQYFLVENFQHVGFDRGGSEAVWNRGIMIWHVDFRTGGLGGATALPPGNTVHGGVTATNNSHRRHNLEGVMVPNQGIAGNMIHSGWYADPFFLPSEVFGPCTIAYHHARGYCEPECSTRFIDGWHTPISNFHAPNNVPVPESWGEWRGMATFPNTTPGTLGATHPDSHPQIVPTGITIRVVGPAGSGRTGHGPTRENPTSFAPWTVIPEIWVDFGPQAAANNDVSIGRLDDGQKADIDFGEVNFGYTQAPGAQVFRVTNTTNQVVENLNISILSHGPGRGPGYGADIRAFTLGLVGNPNNASLIDASHAEAVTGAVITSLAPNAYVEFTIRPMDGLGTALYFDLDEHGRGGLATSLQHVGGFHAAEIAPHRAAVQVIGTGGIGDSFNVSFMVNPSDNVRFMDLQEHYNNATGPRSVQFFTGENWPGARTDDAVPFLEWQDTGMPMTWIPIVGTFNCGSTPTIPITVRAGSPANFVRNFTLSTPITHADCTEDDSCGLPITFDPLPRGLGIFEDTHWFAGHLWGRPTLAGEFNVAFYLRHKSDYAHDEFGGYIGEFTIDVVRGQIEPPRFQLAANGHDIIWYRTMTAHNVLGAANNAAANAALASGAYRVYINGRPHMIPNPNEDEGGYIFLDLAPGAALPLAPRFFDIRDLGLIGEESFEFNMRAIVADAHREHWYDSDLYSRPVRIGATPLMDGDTLNLEPGSPIALQLVNADITTTVNWVLGPYSAPLPHGMTLDAQTGIITGSSIFAGVYNIQVLAIPAANVPMQADSAEITQAIQAQDAVQIVDVQIVIQPRPEAATASATFNRYTNVAYISAQNLRASAAYQITINVEGNAPITQNTVSNANGIITNLGINVGQLGHGISAIRIHLTPLAGAQIGEEAGYTIIHLSDQFTIEIAGETALNDNFRQRDVIVNRHHNARPDVVSDLTMTAQLIVRDAISGQVLTTVMADTARPQRPLLFTHNISEISVFLSEGIPTVVGGSGTTIDIDDVVRIPQP